MGRPGHPFFAGAPLLIAHRGGARVAPENTLAAFSIAVERWGADVLEMDVQLSADGRLVVIHDETVDRTTDGTGAVARMSWAQLRELDAGHAFEDPEGARSFRSRGERLPLFEEVLERFPRVRLNVEAKRRSATGPLIAMIRRHAAESRVLLASTTEAARASRFAYPGPTSASELQLRAMAFVRKAGLSRFHHPRTDAIQPPDEWKGRRVVTPALLAWAHARNLPVHVWTVDDPHRMAELLEWGVDGVQTDRPDLLATVLTERFGRPAPPGLGARGSGEPR